MFSRSAGHLRVTPRLRKFLLATHIMTSVGWLGVVFAKLVLTLAAATAASPEATETFLVGVNAVNAAFAPAATGAMVSGVLLSLGTHWGLVRYYWVVAKLVLTIGVFGTAVQLVPRLLGLSVDEPVLLGLPRAPAVLLGFAAVHLLMLAAATVLAVYKPWGTTWFSRRSEPRRSGQSIRRGATAESAMHFERQGSVGRVA